MKRREFLGATAGLGAATLAGAARADDPIRWKMVTSWPKNFPGLGTTAEAWARAVEKMSGGRLKIHVYGAGELVPAFEVFDAVSQGVAEMGHGASYYWKGKVPEAQFFSTMPFGMVASEMLGWIYKGGGLELWEEVYRPHGLVPMPAGSTYVQLGGWFRKEINSAADLQGLRMRIPGLGGEVLRRAGGTPVNLPGSELLVSLQTGVIDAAEWVGPWNDLALGLYRVAKHYYFPGWQEPNVLVEGLINAQALQALPEDLQAIVRTTAQAVTLDMMATFTAYNHDALTALLEKHEVVLKRFPEEVLEVLREHARAAVEEEASRNEISRRVYESYRGFHEKAKWITHITDDAFLRTRSEVSID